MAEAVKYYALRLKKDGSWLSKGRSGSRVWGNNFVKAKLYSKLSSARLVAGMWAKSNLIVEIVEFILQYNCVLTGEEDRIAENLKKAEIKTKQDLTKRKEKEIERKQKESDRLKSEISELQKRLWENIGKKDTK